MIRLSQRALAYLNEVIHHGSLRRAAQHLNIDPSAISRQLASLEEHLGVRLLQRTPQGVAPTEAGELLVAHYRQQRANEEGVLSRLSALQGLRQGKVRLAVGEGFIADLISQPLQSFILRYPGIELEVRMAGANEGVALVKEDAVDLALVYAPVEIARNPVDALQGIGSVEIGVAHDDRVPAQVAHLLDDQFLLEPHHDPDVRDLRQALEVLGQQRLATNLDQALGFVQSQTRADARRADHSMFNRRHRASPSWTTKSLRPVSTRFGTCTPP